MINFNTQENDIGEFHVLLLKTNNDKHMKFRFPLKDVKIEITNHQKVVESPLFDDGFFRLN